MAPSPSGKAKVCKTFIPRFESGRCLQTPDAYVAPGDPTRAPVFPTNDLSKEFLACSLNEKGNRAPRVAAQKSALAWWMEHLRGGDLRRVSVRAHLDPALGKSPGRRHKIEVIKSFYS